MTWQNEPVENWYLCEKDYAQIQQYIKEIVP